jgi:hypothetical protein
MKKLKFIIFPLIVLTAILGGCKKESDPLDHEQYIKQVYIVGSNKSNNEGLSIVKLPYSKATDQEQVTNLSVATGGSENIDRDISVSLAEAGTDPITRYNFLYLFRNEDIKYQKLNSSFYSMPNKTVGIKAGEVYGTTVLRVKTATLHPDSLYAVTVKIASVSDPNYISIRKADSVLIVGLSLTNDYSDVYQAQGKYYKLVNALPADTVTLSLTRTLKAVDYSTIRFYHLSTEENVTNAAANGIKIKVNDDNSLTITPWGNLLVTAGSGTYNPTSKIFTLSYNYTVSGVIYQFKGTFKRSASAT